MKGEGKKCNFTDDSLIFRMKMQWFFGSAHFAIKLEHELRSMMIYEVAKWLCILCTKQTKWSEANANTIDGFLRNDTFAKSWKKNENMLARAIYWDICKQMLLWLVVLLQMLTQNSPTKSIESSKYLTWVQFECCKATEHTHTRTLIQSALHALCMQLQLFEMQKLHSIVTWIIKWRANS